MKRYFITGTDTDCGKTYVTSELTRFYPNSIAIKPVATGCIFVDNQWVSADAQLLTKQNIPQSIAINPWRFRTPVSPHIASSQEGIRLDAKMLAEFCLNFEAKDKNVLFIEGAGGLMVPLNEQETWMDFLKITRIPVILVVGIKLGCINHALLTEMALMNQGIVCQGWIANCLDATMLALDENIQTLKFHLVSPLLTVLGYKGGIEKIDDRLNIQYF